MDRCRERYLAVDKTRRPRMGPRIRLRVHIFIIHEETVPNYLFAPRRGAHRERAQLSVRAPGGRAPRSPPTVGHGSGVPAVAPGAPHAETPPVGGRMPPRACAPEGRAPGTRTTICSRPGGACSALAAHCRARLRRARGRAGYAARGDAACQEDAPPKPAPRRARTGDALRRLARRPGGDALPPPLRRLNA